MTERSERLVHGMDGRLVEPDWPPIEEGELADVLGRIGASLPPAAELWRSPRPFGAATSARLADGTRVVVKRHHASVRSVAALEEEHRFASYLRGRGLPVPAVLGDGVHTAVEAGVYVYEVWERALGEDLYRDDFSWTPYHSVSHAEAAGRALARLHLLAAGYIGRARSPLPLLGGMGVVAAEDPLAAVHQLASVQKGLGDYLRGRRWERDLATSLLPHQQRALPHVSRLGPLFTHNDWHPSNLLWEPEHGEVSSIIDFGLANRTTACYDLATAIERACVDWLDPGEDRRVESEQLAALLRGYLALRPLGPEEAVALPLLIPVVHVDYALSEIEYFHGIVRDMKNADLAYDSYLLGHLDWFSGAHGNELCRRVERLVAELRPRSR